ncbi:MAG: GtrA family protein [Acutalibacteraceae bacterium]|nr:GtrA family protein [Acutalibacteraceae bacterium]HIR03469.1 GtrA family protein [Candidatus Scatovicinus merdipullorum]
MQFLKTFFDKKFLKFVLVGIINTLVGYGIMLGYYNIATSLGWFDSNTNYWVGSAANYVLTSILSYFLNKYFTFQNKESNKKTVIRFVINIAVCYLLAYGIAKPLVDWIAQNWLAGAVMAVAQWLGTMSFFAEKTAAQLVKMVTDNISMLAGSVFFVMFNYVGQRFFAFKTKEDGREKPEQQPEQQQKKQ